MKTISILGCLWFTLQAPAQPVTPAGEGDFKIVKQDKVVTLYERWIQHPNEKVRELKAVFSVQPADAAKVIRLLQNQQQGTNWNQKAKTYKITPTTQPGQWVNYIKYGMPWPFDDQDCCILYQQQSPGQVTFKSVYCELYPPKKDVTRMEMIKGQWLLEDKGNRQMTITYTISTSKSTSVPAWISDPIVRNNMVETMKAFKNILEDGNTK